MLKVKKSQSVYHVKFVGLFCRESNEIRYEFLVIWIQERSGDARSTYPTEQRAHTGRAGAREQRRPPSQPLCLTPAEMCFKTTTREVRKRKCMKCVCVKETGRVCVSCDVWDVSCTRYTISEKPTESNAGCFKSKTSRDLKEREREEAECRDSTLLNRGPGVLRAFCVCQCCDYGMSCSFTAR